MSDTRRDDRLFSDGPKRILTLDGGGVRSMLTLGVLEHVERILKGRSFKSRQDSFVLADYFDLIAGTSTGAVIAALLAVGRSVADIQAIYRQLALKVFARSAGAGNSLQRRFRDDRLQALLRSHLGDMQLSGQALRTGLLVCTGPIDGSGPSRLANNPRSPSWEKDRHVKLVDLIRASTAGPGYVRPAMIPLSDNASGVFVDGAMAGHANPALAAFLYATAAEYGLGWTTGEDQLYLLSIGAGFRRPERAGREIVRKAKLDQALCALNVLIHETSMTAQHTLQALSRPKVPFVISSEVNGLERTLLGPAPLLQYERIDPSLEPEALREELDVTLPKAQQRDLHRTDIGADKHIDALLKVGRAAGEHLIVDLFPRAFDGP